MRENNASVLKAGGITFRYSENSPLILDDFTAEFTGGCITALTGKNGCGKTTLARIIMGILKPEKGRLSLNGEDLAELSLAETGRRIGYVMQDPGRQIFSTSVMDEMKYGLENMVRAGLLDKDDVESRALEYLELFDLSGKKDAFPFALSQGEKQRLVLAAVTALEPGFLMLDEPTAALDPVRRAALGDHLKKVRDEKGCGIIVITHDRSFVADCADREVRMQNGGGIYV